jgi:leader peptidase (prepilin peptidase) / N-methyltransferase
MELTDRPEPPTPAPEARASGWDFVRALPSRFQVVVAALGTALAVASFLRFGISGHALVGAVFVATLVVLAAVDIDRRLIPNAIVLPALGFVLAAQIAFYPEHWLEWVLSALLAALFFFVPMLVYPAGMGMGDVKLAALMGAALGRSVLGALLVGVFAAAAYSIVILLREGRSARGKGIPYGPFLALGGIVALLLGGH